MIRRSTFQYRFASLRLWLILLLISPSLYSHGAPLIHLQQVPLSLSVNTHTDVLEDPGGKLQFSDVLTAPYIHQFAPANKNELLFSFSQSAYWLRFSIQNHLSKEQKLWLKVDPPNLQEVALYINDRSQTAGNHVESINQPVRLIGNQYPFDEREIKQYPLLLTLLVAPNTSEVYYLRITSNTPINLDLQLSSPEIFSAHSVDQARLSNIALGMLVLLSLANLVLTRIFRDFIYLCYGCYLFSILSFHALASGLLQGVAPIFALWQIPLIHTFICIANCSALYFAHQLLSYQQLQQRWQNIIIVSAAINIIAYFSVFSASLTTTYMFMLAGLTATTIILFAAPLHCYLANNNSFALTIVMARLWTVLVILAGIYAIQTSIAEIYIARVWVTFAFGLEGLIITMTLIAFSLQRIQQQQQQQQLIAVSEAEKKAQTAILSRISHDVRTPMNGVIGMTELLFDTALTAIQKDHLHTIQSSGHALLNLINEILDRSKIDAGKMEIEQMPFDLGLLLNECIDDYRSVAEDKNIELINHIHTDVPTLLLGDAGRLRQILLHFLGNAFKYTEHGEIVLTVAMDTQLSDTHIKFSVSDTGCGISHSDQKKLFSSDDELAEKHEFHFGLGLAIPQQLIDKMQGDIGVESELGKGSTFWFSLPLPTQDISKDREQEIDQALQNQRLLVVDDNQTCRKVIQQQANGWGMNVSTAHSGNEAMAMLRAKINLDSPYDVAIIDHNMPNMTGLQLANKIRDELPIEQQPLLIMLTGLSDAPSQQKAREMGIRKVLTKPVAGKALKITVAQELNNSRSKNKTKQPLSQQRPTLTPAADIRGIKVLLAEDNPVNQKVIIGMLKKLGAHCKAVDNGLQANQALQHEDFDLLLMDCEMPVMDGFEATEKIREWEQETGQPPIPIIALSAHIMDEHKKHSLEVGMNAYLSKPVDYNLLQTTLEQYTKAADQV